MTPASARQPLHDSPWPKVLLLMRCGHAKWAGNLLKKYVHDLNKADQDLVQTRRRRPDGTRPTDGTCRKEWSEQVADLGCN